MHTGIHWVFTEESQPISRPPHSTTLPPFRKEWELNRFGPKRQNTKSLVELPGHQENTPKGLNLYLLRLTPFAFPFDPFCLPRLTPFAFHDDYPSGSVRDPMGPAVGSFRVDRGGSWLSVARNLRSACRASRSMTVFRIDSLGFRPSLRPSYRP